MEPDQLTCPWSDPSYDGPRYHGRTSVDVPFTGEAIRWVSSMWDAAKAVTHAPCGCYAIFLQHANASYLREDEVPVPSMAMRYHLDVHGAPEHVRPLVNAVMERNMTRPPRSLMPHC